MAQSREDVDRAAKIIKQRNTPTSVSLGYAVNEWFSQADLEDSTRNSYAGYISRVIKPVLGGVALKKLGARELEALYSELRRCRQRCGGMPFVEHKTTDEHDCAKLECAPHECNPMAPSTVRQIHSIISSTLNAAVRWGWIDSNPAKVARRPKQPRPNPIPRPPPTPPASSTGPLSWATTGAPSSGSS